ncbi:indole-3-acetic acid-amido synthetase GH3.17-like isoform X2 [Durio zibethinus]|uniref:Indole-3-acetic acid-amido synthetase GH3.17-like isoform X2 n=1 Tax=Durio zibethinus TaxID=66656 RepID=A0A6P5ZKF0_DURZI|nr:indole-3-acetic acid-amido synthetase GH3.17-like isoform X2 [Durio zibethinus]
MARSGYEAGMKMMEELTTNAEQIQEQVLEEILGRNAGTEYLRRFLRGETDTKLFKANVPIVTYEDIKPYIDRIANGEPSDILLDEPVIQFYRSGTSGGQPKLIPTTAELANKGAIFDTLLQSVMTKHFGDLDHAGKRMELMFTKPVIETPSGLQAASVTTSIFKKSGFRTISKLYTSPIETIFCSDTKQSMYCQLLAGLIRRDEVVTVGSTFASTVLRSIKFLEDYWQELCSNIKIGQISDWIIDSGCRNAASLILKHNPDLAYSIENICSCKSWEGIIRKLWPKAKYISAINTGVMSQYTAELEFYGGGLPLVSGFYACSEAICGINLEPLSKSSDVSYTFLPNMAYFEFLPMKKDCVTISQDQAQFDGLSRHESIEKKTNNEDTEPVDLVNVKPGQCYELLVTTSAGLYRYRVGDILMVSGFHNNTPQFRFVERQNVILSIHADKTSEADLSKAVTEAKALLDPLGIFLTGYTSYGDTSSIPGHYVLFWELKGKEGNNIKEVDPKIMVECCSKMEESLNYTYKMYRKENEIAALEIRVVKQGTFDALMDYYVSKGASLSQFKAPSCTKSMEALKILDSRVIGKFFSPKTPI